MAQKNRKTQNTEITDSSDIIMNDNIIIENILVCGYIRGQEYNLKLRIPQVITNTISCYSKEYIIEPIGVRHSITCIDFHVINKELILSLFYNGDTFKLWVNVMDKRCTFYDSFTTETRHYYNYLYNHKGEIIKMIKYRDHNGNEQKGEIIEACRIQQPAGPCVEQISVQQLRNKKYYYIYPTNICTINHHCHCDKEQDDYSIENCECMDDLYG